MPDVAQKITALAAERHGVTLKVAVLRSTTVKPGERRAWFAAREAEGVECGALQSPPGQDRA